MEYPIERIVWFDTALKQVNSTYKPIWKSWRAKEGMKYVLMAVDITIGGTGDDSGNFRLEIYDGKTYSHWGMFPYIFDQSVLGHAQFNTYTLNREINLHGHECKEFTMSAQGQDADKNCRFSAIVWLYVIPMTKVETLEYATKQPRYKYRHGSARTADIEEGGGYG